jgi:hypothetical protein
MTEQANAVTAAEKVVFDLEAKRRVLIETRAADDAERRAVAFAAHSNGGSAEGKAARATLDKLNVAAVRFDSELRSVDDAIAEAQDRLQQARTAEGQASARENALRIRKVNDEALADSVVLDDALHDAAMAIDNLKACWDKFSQAGVASPHHQQLKVNVVNVLSSFLSALPWDFQTLRFNFLPVHQRVDVERLFRTWHAAIEDRYVRPHVGAAEPEAAKEEANAAA